MKGLLCLFTILNFGSHAGFSRPGDPVLDWIERGQFERIESYLQDNDINARVGMPVTTLLVHSILHGNPGTAEWLISKGADIDLPVDGLSPLMYAVRSDELKKISLLLEAGADTEYADPEGNTALFYAAAGGNPKTLKHLLKNGANLYRKNQTWQTAYDIAIRNNKPENARYLRDWYEKNLPDLFDGPYIRWCGKRKIKTFYLVHDSGSQVTRRKKTNFRTLSDPFLLKGFSGDTLDYLIHSFREPGPDSVEEAEKILVLGDIHGGYDSLVLFLQQNGVINPSLQWSWGKGHLVLVGDIFDRGDKVTETLWLIYQLEDQAAKAGGHVHYILGNHEIMVLTGKLNYVSDKYLLMTSRLNLDYSELFSIKTVLGQWLRTRNALVRINGYLFVHAGLSPEIINTGVSLKEINRLMHLYLNTPDQRKKDDEVLNDLLGPRGPFWYRGYLEDNHEYPHLPRRELERVMEHFHVRTIFIGHTNVDRVSPVYSGKVYAIDVPFYTYGYPIRGLLLEGDAIYLLDSGAGKERIR